METKKGFTFPYGAVFVADGINFSIYVKNADAVRLCLFNEYHPDKVLEKIDLYQTGEVWHLLVKGLSTPVVYGYEVTRKDQTELVLDPYAKSIASGPKWQSPSRKDFIYRPLGKVVESAFDWEDDTSPNLPKKDLIIYEMHLRGFTCHSSSQVQHPGTFKGMMEKIPYLLELGVNAIELMPIQEFCEEDVTLVNPESQQKLHNYFGYSTINFFSVMNRYASASDGNKASLEFKALVKELHHHGIEVILDVVFNHTLEGNEQGPALSYKLLDPHAYYMINNENQYLNFSGCGNTFNCNHPITMELIIDALRHWVLEYHVDGFRFDLASVFTRGTDGTPLEKAPLLEFISKDPMLSGVKLIAEPWDAGGLYQVGHFAGQAPCWSDWNGKYRDSVRNFIKGTPNQKGLFASALTGSTELFPQSPLGGVNFVIAHDGFTLNDLVSYNDKHNLNNGDENRDGSNDNNSWNCGFEGATTSKRVLNLRKKQSRNFHLALMLSQGIPMFLMGDEYGHTRFGNNNPWCQDNELNWFLWDKLEENKGLFKYFSFLINFRKNHPLLRSETHWNDKEIQWHGLNPHEPEWEKNNKFVAFSLHFPSGEAGLYAAFNTSHLSQNVIFPSLSEGKSWQWVINTKNAPPHDYFDASMQTKVTENTYRIPPYSSLMLHNPVQTS